MFNLVDVGWFLRLSHGTFQSVIDLAVCGATLAEAIAFSYKVRVAVAVETARSFGTNESNMSSARGIKCGSYTNTLHKQSKYWIRGTSERGTFAAFICTRMPEKQPLPDKLVNHSLSWIIPVCGSPPPLTASTIKSDGTEAPLPLVLPHQDAISSLKAYRADSNDIEWLNCVFWWISLWVIWCQIVFQFSYCSDFSVWK